MTIPLALLLSATGGYVDTVGFLAFKGLFTAHVTGNFVTVGTALTQGGSGAIAKLLALPVFCLAVIATRLVGHALSRRRHPVLRRLLWVQFALLTLGATLAIALDPYPSGDSPEAILTGLTFVTAMAVQNAAHRAHLANAPPSTLMTGTTTQIMIDLADILNGAAQNPAARAKTFSLAMSVTTFAAGCGAGAVLFSLLGTWALTLPAPVILIAAFAEEAGTVMGAAQ